MELKASPEGSTPTFAWTGFSPRASRARPYTRGLEMDWMVKGTELLLHGSSQNIRQLSLLPGAELLRWQEQVFQPATVRPPQPSNPDAFEGDDQ